MSHWNCFVITHPLLTLENVKDMLKPFVTEPSDEFYKIMYEPCHSCSYRRLQYARDYANRVVGNFHQIKHDKELRQLWDETELERMEYSLIPEIDMDCDDCYGSGVVSYDGSPFSKADYFMPIADSVTGQYSCLAKDMPTVSQVVDWDRVTYEEIRISDVLCPYMFFLPDYTWVDMDSVNNNPYKWISACHKIYDKYKNFRVWFFHCHS